MIQEYAHKGIMNKAYANARQSKPHIRYRYKGRAKIVYDLLNKYLIKSPNYLSILDFGAADGMTLKEINSYIKFQKAIGIELSEELVDNLPPLPSNIKIVRGDVMRLSEYIELQNFDIITALCFLEHIESPMKAIQSASSLLKPGGFFVAVWPNRIWDHIFMALASRNEKYHMSKISKNQMISMVSRAGMQLIDYQKTQWIPLRILTKIKGIGMLPIETLLSIEKLIHNIKFLNWSFTCEVAVCRRISNY